MSLFRLDSSIQGANSTSRAVADTTQRAWEASRPGAAVVTRDLAANPIPSDAWQLAASGKYLPADQRSTEQQAAIDLANELAAELLAAQSYIFATPLYNWGVTQHVKAWVDLVLMSDELAPGLQPLKSRPAALIITRGGAYGPGTPSEGWDFATPWYRHMFGERWGLDLHISEVELTLATVNPAMAELIPMAEQNLADGHARAEKHGRLIAGQSAA